MEMGIILENGTQQDVNSEQVEKLISADVVYHCPDCGDNTFHITEGKTWDDIDTILDEEKFV